MRLSSFFINTLREVPSEAEVVSHKLMLRAGMIKRVAAGIYNYQPLGLRVIRKVENIIRNCMNEAGAIEMLMPTVQPSELWVESGRWSFYGKELLRFKDRGDRDFCLGPTHEEVITDFVKGVVNSYKQLPVNFYQIQTKFRDEVRPRFGLMRGREFIMKDAYSFDIDNDSADVSYKKMYDAYCKIFESCGLRYKVVEADSGSIGGSFSHEFMVLANTGEDEVISCNSCSYSANLEKAVVGNNYKEIDEELLDKEEVATPNLHSAIDVANFLNVDIKKVPKTMIVKVEGVKENNNLSDKLVAVVVRGDREVNLIKIKNILCGTNAEFASPEEVISAVGCPIGSLGPINMPLPVYVDNELEFAKNIVIGANKDGYHIKNVNPSRDFNVKYADIRNAEVGDTCAKCGGTYEITRGIEVGHIFKLGTKYSSSMNATVLDKNGKAVPFIMGCYGIGVGRTVASAIEQNNDEKGIIWPRAIAPFEIVVVSLNSNDDEVNKISNEIYTSLKNSNIDVLLDDRNERAGVKLIDSELIGYPLRISVGKKSLADGNVEITVRQTNETVSVSVDKCVETAIDLLNKVN